MAYDYTTFASTPPKDLLLFHYTTMGGLIGIIESGQIFASHIQYLNDSAEFTYAIDRIQQELRSLNAEGEFAGRPELAACIEEFESPPRTQLPAVYVTSFSEKRDSLSQWRAYAPRGGVAIGVNAEKLKTVAQEQAYWLAKCAYQEAEQRQFISKIVSDYLNTNASVSPGRPGARLYQLLLTAAPAMKHHSFQDEAEWRLISYFASAMESMKRVYFRSDGSMAIPFRRVDLRRKDEPVGLAEIIVVGPTPHPELSQASIQLMVYKSGFRHTRPRVVKSDIPYRNW